MAVADRTIDPRILDSAKKELLAHGFEKTSLKAICQDAGITTGALYKRYKSKEDLFCAVVADTVADLEAIVDEKSGVDLSRLSDRELIDAWDMNVDYMMWWFRFLYDRHDGFGPAPSLRRRNVILQLSARLGGEDDRGHRRLPGGSLSPAADGRGDFERELHILLSAFWTTIYEPFIHDFTWEQIEAHCLLVCRLFNWFEVLQFSRPRD